MDYLQQFVYGIYPYLAGTIFLLGSLLRFEREQYTWKSDSSQLLRTGSLRWGSNLFHIGVLFLFFGHTFGIHTADGNYAHTACIGFGLERIALALFMKHGFDPDHWPASVKSVLGL